MIKFAVKNAFTDKYLAKATNEDRMFIKQRSYAFHSCNAVDEIALFDSKEDAIKAYEQSCSNRYNETGAIVEMIVCE